MDIKGKRLFITGATSGIGEACAKRAAYMGASLVLLGRRRERLEKLSSFLKGEYGTEVYILSVDVRSWTDLKRAAEEKPSLFRDVDVLINNAGKAKGLDPVHEGRLEHWEEMIDTNLKGLLYVTRLVLPHMVDRGRGHVVNIGSVSGHWVYAGGTVYCATKYGVRALTEGLRLDLCGKGIRVTEIDPGMVETEFSEVRFDGDKSRAKDVYRGFTPLTADDVADAVLWAATRPEHVNVQTLILYPTDQASVTMVHRKE